MRVRQEESLNVPVNASAIRSARRIWIAGAACAGKTSLGRMLARSRGIHHYQMDDLYWDRDWQQKTRHEFLEQVGRVVDRDEWIIDGQYEIAENRIARRTRLFIWLDISRMTSMYRTTRRSISRAIRHESICNGNTETFRNMVGKESVLKWAWTQHAATQARAAERLNELSARGVCCVRCCGIDEALDAFGLQNMEQRQTYREV